MMNKNKLTDIYESTLAGAQGELRESSTDYADGFEDGSYVFFRALLGEVSS